MGKYLDEMSDAYVSRLLSEMYMDNVVDIFTDIRPIKRKKYIGLLPSDEADKFVNSFIMKTKRPVP